jgi:hypothetical protein
MEYLGCEIRQGKMKTDRQLIGENEFAKDVFIEYPVIIQDDQISNNPEF